VRGDQASAAAAFGRWNPWCRFETGPAAGLAGLAAASFDCVTFDDGFAALPAPLEALRHARRLITPRGAVLIALADPQPQRLQRLASLCGEAGLVVDLGEAVRDEAGRTTHAVVRAALPGHPRLMVQAMALRPSGAVTDKRIAEPNDFLRTLPGVMTVTEIDTASPRDFPGERIVVAQRRGLGRDDVPDLRRTARMGYLMVGEIDDHPDYLTLIADRDYIGLRGMHALQTSTPRLAEILRHHVGEVAVFANQMPEILPQRDRPGDGVVRIFFGAFNREADWAPLMPALDHMLGRHGERLHFTVIHDRAFFDRLATPAKEFTPACAYPEYLERLGGCDLALLPLGDTPFNQAKSDVKFIECAAAGVTVLASPTVYADSVADGRTGLLYRDADDFTARLDRLIADPAECRAIAARARAWAIEHRLMARHFRARYDWYRSLLARRAELATALFSRLDAISPDPQP
jgi:SAM-dependent methyltransferase